MDNFYRILNYSKCYWKQLSISVIAAILSGVFSALPTYIVQYAIDEIFVKHKENLLTSFIFAFIGIFILKGITAYLTTYYMHWVGNKVINDIRQDLFSRIIYFPLSFFKQKTTGELMAHFLNDIRMIQNASSSAIRYGIQSFFQAFFLLGVAFIQNPKLSVFILFMAPFIVLSIRSMGTAVRNTARTIQNEMGSVSSLLQEVFVGIREIKAFNAEEHECKRFSSYLNNYFLSLMKNIHAESWGPALIEVISMGGCSLIFYIAAHQVLSGVITPGQLGSFFAAVFLAYQPIKRIITTYTDIQNGLAAADRIFALMDTTYTQTNRTLTFNNFTDKIEIEELSFYYIKNKPIFNNVSLTIKKGDRIGIIGTSGGGKSTLCDLFLGLIDPVAGSIVIDNNDLTRLSLQSLRHHIGYVSQSSFLFNDTVAANIAYSVQGATDETIINACKQANAHEFILALPAGYNTIVGENGTLLSGGQKQRITIARALLKKPSILILDEATSSLDQTSEEIICDTIKNLSRDTTVIVVSHRPSPIKHMDRVLVLEHQNLIEISAHDFNTIQHRIYSDKHQNPQSSL